MSAASSTNAPLPPETAPQWATIIGVAVVYYVAAVASLLLALGTTNASPVWPPSGIALAAVLMFGRRVWPGILAGAFAANIVVFIAHRAASVWVMAATSMGIAIGSTLGVLAAGVLLRRWLGTAQPLNRAEGASRFIGAVLLTCGLSSVIGPMCVGMARIVPWEMFWTVWFTRLLGEATGMLLLGAVFLAWWRPPEWKAYARRWPEITGLIAALVAAGLITFGGWLMPPNTHYPLTYLPFPLLLWAMFRFDPRISSGAILVVSGIAVWGTVQGNGPFARGTVNESLLLLQSFVGVTSVSTLVAGAVVTERRDLTTEIRTLNSTLEQHVGERTAELAAANEQLHTLSRRLLVAQESERRRIARELHDDVGQAITASQLRLRALQRRPAIEPFTGELEENVRVLEQALERVRDLSLDLRPSMLDDLGLVSALRWYTSHQAQLAGLRPVFRAEPMEDRLDPALESACFRIAQEAVTNVVRHAQAKKITVELGRENGELHLLVRDDGVGFDVGAVRQSGVRDSLGLLGMEERVSLVGGRVEFRSALQHGTEVHVWLPVHRPLAGPKSV